MDLAATTGWDVLVYGVPSTVIALGTILTAYWARGARSQATSAKDEAQQAARQVSSPNGVTTGEAVDQLRRDMVTIKLNHAEFRESVRASRILTAEVQSELRQTREDLSSQITRAREEVDEQITALREYTDEKLALREQAMSGQMDEHDSGMHEQLDRMEEKQ